MRDPPDLGDAAGGKDPQAECADERRVPVRLQREHGEPAPRPPEERVVILFGLGPSLAERQGIEPLRASRVGDVEDGCLRSDDPPLVGRVLPDSEQ